MHVLEFLTNFVSNHEVLAYGLIFVGLIIEGEFMIISAGILAHLGVLNFFMALLFILLGGFVKSILGYYVGRAIYRRWHSTKFCRYIEHRVHHVMPRFRQKPFWSIFLSKFIMGANHLVIVFSGFQRVDYRKYLKAETIATLIWAPGLLTLGYIFSLTALNITREIWEFALIIFIFVVIFIILDKTLGWLYGLVAEMMNGEYTDK